MIGSASSASVFRIGPEVRSIVFCFTHFLKSLPVKIIKFTSAANMSAWRTMIRITYEEGKVNLENREINMPFKGVMEKITRIPK